MNEQRRRTLIWTGAAGLIAAAGWAVWRRSPGLRLPAQAVPDSFWTHPLTQADGQPWQWSGLRGRFLVINFWASWCPPCLKEMPDLDRFAAAYEPQGWSVVGVAVDQPQAVSQFLRRQPVRFPIAVSGAAGMTLMRDLGNVEGGLPFTVLCDRDGRLRARKTGATHFDELASWVRAVGA